MDDKILERMLDNLIEEAGKIAVKNMESKEEEIPEVQFSKEHEERVKKIFADARKEKEAKEKLKINDNVNAEKDTTLKKKKTKFKFKRLAVLAAILIVLSGLLTTTNGWRDSFLKYFFDFKDEYSDVKKIPEGNEAYINDIYFGYIPNGFKYEVLKESLSQIIIEFIYENEFILFKVAGGDWGREINTEDAIIEEILLNGKDMIYYENAEEKSLTWQENDKICVLTTNCQKELILRIAEEIKLENERGPQK